MSATEDPMTMGGANVVVVGALQPVVDHLWQLNSLVSTEALNIEIFGNIWKIYYYQNTFSIVWFVRQQSFAIIEEAVVLPREGDIFLRGQSINLKIDKPGFKLG